MTSLRDIRHRGDGDEHQRDHAIDDQGTHCSATTLEYPAVRVVEVAGLRARRVADDAVAGTDRIEDHRSISI